MTRTKTKLPDTGILTAALAATGGFLKSHIPGKAAYIRLPRKVYLNKDHPGVRNPKIAANVNMLYEKWRAQYPEGTSALHPLRSYTEPLSNGEGKV